MLSEPHLLSILNKDEKYEKKSWSEWLKDLALVISIIANIVFAYVTIITTEFYNRPIIILENPTTDSDVTWFRFKNVGATRREVTILEQYAEFDIKSDSLFKIDSALTRVAKYNIAPELPAIFQWAYVRLGKFEPEYNHRYVIKAEWAYDPVLPTWFPFISRYNDSLYFEYNIKNNRWESLQYPNVNTFIKYFGSLR